MSIKSPKRLDLLLYKTFLYKQGLQNYIKDNIQLSAIGAKPFELVKAVSIKTEERYLYFLFRSNLDPFGIIIEDHFYLSNVKPVLGQRVVLIQLSGCH